MRSKSPRAVWGLGAGRVKWCSGVGEGASFEKACSRLRQSMFFTSHVCQRFFQGAAAAAAGRGSPPPPRAGEARWFAASVSCLCFVFPFRKDRCVLMISRKTRRGLMGPGFLSPLARGGPGGARTREIACFLRRKPLQNTRNGGVGARPGGART